MKIGILGSGDVGQALGTGFVALGHDVKLGSRQPDSDKLRPWRERSGALGSTGTFGEAAAHGEVVVVATLWGGTESALDLAGADHLAGKVVIDVTNPLEFSQGAPGLALGRTDSAGEQVQRWLPDARVVKAFNTVGHALMFRPDLPGGPPDMFICGNDEAAKAVVAGICADFGWGVVDIGPIQGARLLEPVCLLWLVIGFKHRFNGHAFKLLHR